jgi:hypothetical protein
LESTWQQALVRGSDTWSPLLINERQLIETSVNGFYDPASSLSHINEAETDAGKQPVGRMFLTEANLSARFFHLGELDPSKSEVTLTAGYMAKVYGVRQLANDSIALLEAPQSTIFGQSEIYTGYAVSLNNPGLRLFSNSQAEELLMYSLHPNQK